MSILWVVGIGVGYLVFVAFLLLIVQSKNRGRRVERVAASVGLPLTDQVEPIVRRGQQDTARVGLVGVALGVTLATVYDLLSHIDSSLQVFYVDFTGVIAGLGLGGTIAAFAHETNRQKGSVRLARLNAVSLSDYRSPFEQWVPGAVVVLALLGLAARGAIYPRGYASVPVFLWIYAAVIVVTLVISEVASRALVGSGQPARPELDLAWDDALKSRALASIAATPTYLGAYLGLVAYAFFPATHQGATALGSGIENVIQMVALVLVLVWIGTSVATTSHQRYLRRLWPDLGVGMKESHA